MRGILDACKLCGKCILQTRKQLHREPNSRPVRKMIAEDVAVGWYSFGDQLAEPVEQTVVGRLAEVIWRHDQRGVIAKVECQLGEFYRFGEARRTRAGNQTELRECFTRLT